MPKPVYVWGIDPGNEAAGVALLRPDRLSPPLLLSRTVVPWDPRPLDPFLPLLLSLPPGESVCYVEVPQNGTHSSRGGVTFAAGMLVDALARVVLDAWGVDNRLRRSMVKKVKPDTWRAGLGMRVRLPGGREAHKQAALDLVTELYEPLHETHVASSDEAEAILIGRHGALETGGRKKKR